MLPFCRIGARGPIVIGIHTESRFLGSSLKMEGVYIGNSMLLAFTKSSCTSIRQRVWAVPHVVLLREQCLVVVWRMHALDFAIDLAS